MTGARLVSATLWLAAFSCAGTLAAVTGGLPSFVAVSAGWIGATVYEVGRRQAYCAGLERGRAEQRRALEEAGPRRNPRLNVVMP